MFSGIIEDIGQIRERAVGSAGARLVIDSRLTAELGIGESIAVNGVCLTVVERDATAFVTDLSPTTLSVTTLGGLDPGQPVNLERALRVGDRLSGHFVSGHVDAVGHVREAVPDGSSRHLGITAPHRLRPYLVEKGSVTVDGVSLTIVAVAGNTFQVTVIPHTLAVTTLARLAVADPVNLECDLLGKYVHRLLAPEGEPEEGDVRKGDPQ
jgi:riboflavin synthase